MSWRQPPHSLCPYICNGIQNNSKSAATIQRLAICCCFSSCPNRVSRCQHFGPCTDPDCFPRCPYNHHFYWHPKEPFARELFRHQFPPILSKPFPFLELPGEIRNRIYRYALIGSKGFSVQLQFGSLDTGMQPSSSMSRSFSMKDTLISIS